MLTYYSEPLPGRGGLTYVPASNPTSNDPDLMLTHTFGLADKRSAAVEMIGRNGQTYRLVRRFPYGGMSGWNWYIYQREDRPQPLLELNRFGR